MISSRISLPELPITSVLSEIGQSLATGNRLVLSAPPGAGKTTTVSLYLVDQEWCTGRIILLEPRRLAARAPVDDALAPINEAVIVEANEDLADGGG